MKWPGLALPVIVQPVKVTLARWCEIEEDVLPSVEGGIPYTFLFFFTSYWTGGHPTNILRPHSQLINQIRPAK